MMEKGEYQKLILWGGTVLFFVLLAMSQLFYRERLFADSSYYAVNIIQWERFRFDHQRFVLIFAEWLPLVAIKLGLSLTHVLQLYSLGHVLFFFLLFLISIVFLRDYGTALSILLIHTTNTVFLYYTPMVEIWYGAALGLIFYSLLRKEGKGFFSFALLVLIEITVLFSHPENFILVFIFLAIAVEKNKKIRTEHRVLLVTFLAALIFKFLTFSSYEAEKVNHALDVDGSQDTFHLLNLDYVTTLLLMLIKNYTFVVGLFFLSLLYLLRAKLILRSFILAFGFIGTIVLVNSVTSANVYDWYFEAMYMPMVVISIAVFFSETAGLISKKSFTVILIFIGIFTLYSISNQWLVTKDYSNRISHFEKAIDNLKGKDGNKFIVQTASIGLSASDLNWSIPMEMLLLSAEQGKENTLSVGTPDDIAFEDVKRIQEDSTLFMLRRWDIISVSELNTFYFVSKPGAYKTQ